MFGLPFGKKADQSRSPASSKVASRKPAGGKPAPARGPRVNLEKRFSIIAETGSGSMSRVYKASDNQTGRIVCLKVQDQAKTKAALARSGLSLTGALSEGSIGQKIIHPNVVRTWDHGTSNKGDHFIVMEFIDGTSLTFVRQSRPLSLPDKLELLAQTAEGLAAVHEAGFVHHDFGPKNVMVTRDDQVKIIDFGLSVPNLPAFNRPGNRTGTLAYMAPELLRREETSERIDIFSYGVLAFEFLTGKMPYDATDQMGMIRQRINSEPIDIARLAPDLPPDLQEIVRRALRRKPQERWPDMKSLASALRDIIPAVTPKPEPAKSKTPSQRPRSADLSTPQGALHRDPHSGA
jgi:serine/threonine protein kinase